VEIDRKFNLLRLLRHEVGFVFQLHNLSGSDAGRGIALIPTVPREPNRRIAQAACASSPIEPATHRLGNRIFRNFLAETAATALCRALMNKPRSVGDDPRLTG